MRVTAFYTYSKDLLYSIIFETSNFCLDLHCLQKSDYLSPNFSNVLINLHSLNIVRFVLIQIPQTVLSLCKNRFKNKQLFTINTISLLFYCENILQLVIN